jgi:hypothetical protein
MPLFLKVRQAAKARLATVFGLHAIARVNSTIAMPTTDVIDVDVG